MNERPSLFTIGHSNHPIDTFIGLLDPHRVATLIDVRSYPSSRRWPQFNQVDLQASLQCAGIAYRWAKALGGRRHSKRTDSPHIAWEHPAFRAYADYTGTPEFAAGLDELMRAVHEVRTAIMCSEGLWWRCHRRIIADHMTVRGCTVMHVMPSGDLSVHALPNFATVDGDLIVYNCGQQSLNLK